MSRQTYVKIDEINKNLDQVGSNLTQAKTEIAKKVTDSGGTAPTTEDPTFEELASSIDTIPRGSVEVPISDTQVIDAIAFTDIKAGDVLDIRTTHAGENQLLESGAGMYWGKLAEPALFCGRNGIAPYPNDTAWTSAGLKEYLGKCINYTVPPIWNFRNHYFPHSAFKDPTNTLFKSTAEIDSTTAITPLGSSSTTTTLPVLNALYVTGADSNSIQYIRRNLDKWVYAAPSVQKIHRVFHCNDKYMVLGNSHRDITDYDNVSDKHANFAGPRVNPNLGFMARAMAINTTCPYYVAKKVGGQYIATDTVLFNENPQAFLPTVLEIFKDEIEEEGWGNVMGSTASGTSVVNWFNNTTPMQVIAPFYDVSAMPVVRFSKNGRYMGVVIPVGAYLTQTQWESANTRTYMERYTYSVFMLFEIDPDTLERTLIYKEKYNGPDDDITESKKVRWFPYGFAGIAFCESEEDPEGRLEGQFVLKKYIRFHNTINQEAVVDGRNVQYHNLIRGKITKDPTTGKSSVEFIDITPKLTETDTDSVGEYTYSPYLAWVAGISCPSWLPSTVPNYRGVMNDAISRPAEMDYPSPDVGTALIGDNIEYYNLRFFGEPDNGLEEAQPYRHHGVIVEQYQCGTYINGNHPKAGNVKNVLSYMSARNKESSPDTVEAYGGDTDYRGRIARCIKALKVKMDPTKITEKADVMDGFNTSFNGNCLRHYGKELRATYTHLNGYTNPISWKIKDSSDRYSGLAKNVPTIKEKVDYGIDCSMFHAEFIWDVPVVNSNQPSLTIIHHGYASYPRATEGVPTYQASRLGYGDPMLNIFVTHGTKEPDNDNAPLTIEQMRDNKYTTHVSSLGFLDQKSVFDCNRDLWGMKVERCITDKGVTWDGGFRIFPIYVYTARPQVALQAALRDICSQVKLGPGILVRTTPYGREPIGDKGTMIDKDYARQGLYLMGDYRSTPVADLNLTVNKPFQDLLPNSSSTHDGQSWGVGAKVENATKQLSTAILDINTELNMMISSTANLDNNSTITNQGLLNSSTNAAERWENTLWNASIDFCGDYALMIPQASKGDPTSNTADVLYYGSTYLADIGRKLFPTLVLAKRYEDKPFFTFNPFISLSSDTYGVNNIQNLRGRICSLNYRSRVVPLGANDLPLLKNSLSPKQPYYQYTAVGNYSKVLGQEYTFGSYRNSGVCINSKYFIFAYWEGKPNSTSISDGVAAYIDIYEINGEGEQHTLVLKSHSPLEIAGKQTFVGSVTAVRTTSFEWQIQVAINEIKEDGTCDLLIGTNNQVWLYQMASDGTLDLANGGTLLNTGVTDKGITTLDITNSGNLILVGYAEDPYLVSLGKVNGNWMTLGVSTLPLTGAIFRCSFNCDDTYASISQWIGNSEKANIIVPVTKEPQESIVLDSSQITYVGYCGVETIWHHSEPKKCLVRYIGNDSIAAWGIPDRYQNGYATVIPNIEKKNVFYNTSYASEVLTNVNTNVNPVQVAPNPMPNGIDLSGDVLIVASSISGTPPYNMPMYGNSAYLFGGNFAWVPGDEDAFLHTGNKISSYSYLIRRDTSRFTIFRKKEIVPGSIKENIGAGVTYNPLPMDYNDSETQWSSYEDMIPVTYPSTRVSPSKVIYADTNKQIIRPRGLNGMAGQVGEINRTMGQRSEYYVAEVHQPGNSQNVTMESFTNYPNSTPNANSHPNTHFSSYVFPDFCIGNKEVVIMGSGEMLSVKSRKVLCKKARNKSVFKNTNYPVRSRTLLNNPLIPNLGVSPNWIVSRNTAAIKQYPYVSVWEYGYRYNTPTLGDSLDLKNLWKQGLGVALNDAKAGTPTKILQILKDDAK